MKSELPVLDLLYLHDFVNVRLWVVLEHFIVLCNEFLYIAAQFDRVHRVHHIGAPLEIEPELL